MRAGDDNALGLVVHIAEVEKEREVAAQGNLAEDVDVKAVVAPGEDGGADAIVAGRGDRALATLALVVEIYAEVVAGAGEADAPIGTFGLIAGEEIGGGAGDALAAEVAEDLDAARPVREKREGLFVVEIEALDARGRGEIILRGDVVFAVDGGIEAVEREKFGRRGGVVLGEEIFEVAAESAG